jgi:glycosyltransferase involved in cell wall biosynthesis
MINAMSEILLSFLIPSYQFSVGVSRILTGLGDFDSSEIEVIIFHDSIDHDVENVCLAQLHASPGCLRYVHNRPPLGAVANWNALLDSARGKYCLLCHHDEFPVGDNFIQDLVATLRNNPDIDVVLLDCVLFQSRPTRNRRHLPNWLRGFVVNYFPQYLHRRNVIGPTAALVARRSMYPRFDVQLQWLVDVDAYVRLFRVAKRFLLCPNIQIGSLLGRSESITARLGASIPKMAQNERAYLRKRHTDTIWLGPYPQEPVVNGLTRAFEALCWWVLRGLTRVAARCYPRTDALRTVCGKHFP